MKRTAAAALAASLQRLRTPEPAAPKAKAKASGLSACVLCHRDFVVPVQWEPVGEDRWWMFLRCAECGTSREVTVSNAVARRYDEELAAGSKTINRAARRLEHERMSDEVDAFVDALERGFIAPADFTH